VDGLPLPFEPGDVIRVDRLDLLRPFIPVEIWAQRERLFWEGMRLEIGPCYADYSPPGFFADTTRHFAGQARLIPGDAEQDGGLMNHTAGLPFPPAEIAADDPRAGARWAWNFVHRYRGAGAFQSRFRAAHLASLREESIHYYGDRFQALLTGRADRPQDGYRHPGKKDLSFVSGGRFEKPADAHGVAWRLYRQREAERDARLQDDVFRYEPGLRRVRRSPDLPYWNHIPFAGDQIRPNQLHWRVLGTRDLLAIANAREPLFPETEDRDYGPWGLSFASDRWELRRALVLEGTPREEASISRRILYLDLQTLALLYKADYDANDEPTHPAYHVLRWSEDRPDHPRGPDDPERPVRALIPIAHVTFTEHGGCRIEAGSTVATPPPDRKLDRLLSASRLQREAR
jgi:hypothetical protein